MSEVSHAPTEQIAKHPLENVFEKLKYLVESMELELEVAPHDYKAHQDLLRRTIKAAESGLQIPDEAWPDSEKNISREPKELTKEELEFLESSDTWITEMEIGQEIDVDAINRCLKKYGFTQQVSFEESPEV
ncbi:hypothetical protein PN499_06100 [Kamptonema animale CS-326]|jgi:hypothetical protein|uniref:hypothetical protein n=1 Tax=Kamptonema animale TaxID=92934 RepID=UPI00232EF13F|nr:hypothetical protein [Kamptonema animale]MDB9510748.1 hypothetical protein [Kamptonema animale CS-326]